MKFYGRVLNQRLRKWYLQRGIRKGRIDSRQLKRFKSCIYVNAGGLISE